MTFKQVQLENIMEMIKRQPKGPLWFSLLIPNGNSYLIFILMIALDLMELQ